MALNAYARTATDRLVTPVGRWLVQAGATPNGITTFGLVMTGVGAAIVVGGHPLLGAFVLAFANATDALDGTVARLRGTASKLGAFYDSVADRANDVVLFGAAAWLVRDDPLLFTLAIIAFGSAQMTSYIRAKAEALGWHATVGLMERAERVIILILAIGFGFVPLALWILSVGGVITIAQRLRAVMAQAPAS